MTRFLIPGLLLAASCFAQGVGDLLNRPPAGVDEVVRQRVTEYFTLQMEGKFRQAESLVCEASRDAYYDMEKTRWKSVEVQRVNYEDNFTTAKAIVVLGTTLNTLRGVLPARYPYTSIWKLQDGAWCFYIDPERAKTRETPFGTMHAGPDPVSGQGGGFSMPNPEDIKRAFLKGVSVSQERIVLPGHEKGEARIEVRNRLPGVVELELSAFAREGVTARLDKQKLGANESATLEILHAPSDARPKAPLKLQILVSPGGHALTVEVAFTTPPAEAVKLPPPMHPKP